MVDQEVEAVREAEELLHVAEDLHKAGDLHEVEGHHEAEVLQEVVDPVEVAHQEVVDKAEDLMEAIAQVGVLEAATGQHLKALILSQVAIRVVTEIIVMEVDIQAARQRMIVTIAGMLITGMTTMQDKLLSKL